MASTGKNRQFVKDSTKRYNGNTGISMPEIGCLVNAISVNVPCFAKLLDYCIL
jgi:hypothetical protein